MDFSRAQQQVAATGGKRRQGRIDNNSQTEQSMRAIPSGQARIAVRTVYRDQIR
jgi:hypothetical protein